MLFLDADNLLMSPERTQFVERLVDVVEELNYPEHGRQTALARRYKLTQPSVRKWFTGEAMPSYEIAADLCKRSMVAYEWLMTGRGEKYLLDTEGMNKTVLAGARLLMEMSPQQAQQAVKILDAIAEPPHPKCSGTAP